jgi:hypothetical protein
MKKLIRKMIQGIIKYRIRPMMPVFADVYAVEEWILFGKFVIAKRYREIK